MDKEDIIRDLTEIKNDIGFIIQELSIKEEDELQTELLELESIIKQIIEDEKKQETTETKETK